MDIETIAQTAFKTAMAAEEAWVRELERVYGKNARDARYDRRLNKATPELELLYSIRAKTLRLWGEISDELSGTKRVA
jgi:hypothetical protein